MAKLYFEHGPMGSKKSTNVLSAAHNYVEHGSNVLLAKPAIDTKGDRMVVSRIGIKREVDFLITPELDVQAEVLRRRNETERQKINAVLVDEAQFLKPKQVDELFSLAVVHSIPVLTWGLRTDFQTHSFPGSARLMEIAHVIRETIAMCGHGNGCEHHAQFNARLRDGEYVTEGSQVAIDGEGDVTYNSLCDVHYLQNVGPVRADYEQ